MKIRSAQPDDIDGMSIVHVQSWQETYRGLLPQSVIDSYSRERRADQWRRALNDPSRVMILAEENDGLMGFAVGGPGRDADLSYDAEIYALYVLQCAQRRGVGRALFYAPRARLALPCYLWVFATNESACRFYEKLGGVIISRKHDFYGDACVEELAYGWNKL